jgi:hypothetical protein
MRFSAPLYPFDQKDCSLKVVPLGSDPFSFFLLPEELSATLHRLFDARQEDDYRRVDPILLEETTEFITVAEGFVHSIRVKRCGEYFEEYRGSARSAIRRAVRAIRSGDLLIGRVV